MQERPTGTLLQKERYDPFHALLILRILIGELFAHHFFFSAQFDPQAYEHEDNAQQAGDVTCFKPRSDEHGKQAGVDRMTDQPVRAAHNQFVIFF